MTNINPKYVHAIVLVLLTLWVIGIYADVFVSISSLFIMPALLLKNMYSVVCHQLPAKLIYINDITSNVCSRCFGIYSGALFISLILFIKNVKIKNSKLYLFLFTPMLIDVLSLNIGLYNYSKTIAFITGALAGSAGFLYFYISINNLLEELKFQQ